MTLQKDPEHQSESLTPYCFHHRYAKQGIAETMGDNVEVHLMSYARFVIVALATNFIALTV